MTNAGDTLADRRSRALAWTLKSRLGTAFWRYLDVWHYQFIELLGNFCFQIQVRYRYPLRMRCLGLPVFRFEPEKALEAILYVASKAQTDKYATLKILYLADKLHLERYGRFISGDYYHALRHGSTPMHSYDMLEYAAHAKNQCVIEGVREALSNTSWKDKKHPFCYKVKSDWLIALVDEIIRGKGKGFAYNVDVRILAEERLGGFPKRTQAEYSQEGTPLSTLIYNAQCFRRSDDLLTQGYVPVSQEMVDQAFAAGGKIQTPGQLYNVRKVNGKCYAIWNC